MVLLVLVLVLLVLALLVLLLLLLPSRHDRSLCSLSPDMSQWAQAEGPEHRLRGSHTIRCTQQLQKKVLSARRQCVKHAAALGRSNFNGNQTPYKLLQPLRVAPGGMLPR